MTAPICAISFTGPNRSSLAISESCNVDGNANGASDSVSTYALSCSVTNSDSSTVLVSSSTNSGTPSVFWTIWSRTSSGSGFPPVSRSSIVVTWLRLKRFRVSDVICVWPVQGEMKSARKVMSSSALVPCALSTMSVNSSSVVGSAQCTSSKKSRTGRCWLKPSICPMRASSVFFFCISGVISEGA